MAEVISAIRKGDISSVKTILAQESVLYTVSEEGTGNSFLHVSVFQRNLEMIKFFIASGKIDTNPVNDAKDTPLHVLVKSGNISMRAVMIADLLVKAGTDPMLRNIDDKTAADILSATVGGGNFSDQLLKILQQPCSSPKRLDQSIEVPKVHVEPPSTVPSPPAEKFPRPNSLEKLLSLRIPDIRPVPYKKTPASARSASPSPVKSFRKPATPPSEPDELPIDFRTNDESAKIRGEIERLKAENEALKSELNKCRTLLHAIDARQQLRIMYSRLLELESIESALDCMEL
jgi:hypothetical protein